MGVHPIRDAHEQILIVGEVLEDVEEAAEQQDNIFSAVTVEVADARPARIGQRDRIAELGLEGNMRVDEREGGPLLRSCR